MEAQSRNDNYPIHRTLAESQPDPIVDDDGAGTIYTGYAPLGTKTSDPKWKIKKSTKSGNVTTVNYAEGDMNYTHVWDDRATLSYAR